MTDGYWWATFTKGYIGVETKIRVVEVREPWVFITGDNYWYKPEYFVFLKKAE